MLVYGYETGKEIENTAGTIRADKAKAEKASTAAKKGCECPSCSLYCCCFVCVVLECMRCGFLVGDGAIEH
jgi:hypothetical protein